MHWETKTKIVWVALFWYLLYCSGLEPNPQYFWGTTVLDWFLPKLQTFTLDQMEVEHFDSLISWEVTFNFYKIYEF